MQDETPTPPPAAPPAAGVEDGAVIPTARRATEHLREFLDASDAFEKQLGRELGLNPTDLDAMEHLLMSGPLTPTELSHRLGISTAATSTAVDRLVGLGHARREPKPRDRRGVLVVASADSAVLTMRRLMPLISGIDDVLDSFDDEAQRAITDYIRRVVEVCWAHAARREGP